MELNQTIQFLESEIAAYDAEIALLEATLTPRPAQRVHVKTQANAVSREQSRDSGNETAIGATVVQNSGRKRVTFGHETSFMADEQGPHFDVDASNTMFGRQANGREPQTPSYRHVLPLSSTPLFKSQDSGTGDTVRPKTTDKQSSPVDTSKKDGESKPDDPPSSRKLPAAIKPATFDGSTSWLDYLCHFEACSVLGKWTEQEKSLYLAVSLRGQAQAVLGNMPGGSPQSYGELVKALNERFSPPNQTELYRAQLRDVQQKDSESLPELGQRVRRLTNLAYPSAQLDLRETLAKEQFLDALVDSDMRLRIKQARPTHLNEAIRHAIELEAFHRAEKKHDESKGYIRSVSNASEQGSMQSQIAQMQRAIKQVQIQLEYMTQAQRSINTEHDSQFSRIDQNRRQCFKCGRRGHIQRDCRSNDESFSNSQSTQSVHTSGDTGMFVEAEIQGAPVCLLVDTGATVSILSQKVYDLVCENSGEGHPLGSVKRAILSANETPLTVFGKAELTLQLGRTRFKHMFVVGDVSVDGILGLDFMRDYECTVDISRQSLIVKGSTISMLQGNHGGYSHCWVASPRCCDQATFGGTLNSASSDLHEQQRNSAVSSELYEQQSDNPGTSSDLNEQCRNSMTQGHVHPHGLTSNREIGAYDGCNHASSDLYEQKRCILQETAASSEWYGQQRVISVDWLRQHRRAFASTHVSPGCHNVWHNCKESLELHKLARASRALKEPG